MDRFCQRVAGGNLDEAVRTAKSVKVKLDALAASLKLDFSRRGRRAGGGPSPRAPLQHLPARHGLRRTDRIYCHDARAQGTIEAHRTGSVMPHIFQYGSL